MRYLWMVLLLAVPVVAKDDVKEREPGPKSKGKVYSWHAKEGLVYRYYVPKKYDAKKGANLTLILHGSNLSAGWGFWNHKAGEFRPDDIVVSPDGTTPNGRGGFNFLGARKDAKRLHALHLELKEIFKLGHTYLYGHSQGSFFAFYYAGEFPDDVQGLVGHASGVWTQTQQTRKGHGQAIVLMHGTYDPVVPYRQSVGGLQSFRDAKYPIVRLRSLEGWNHWPAEHNGPIPHTSRQLAWVEGMTTDDPARLEICFGILSSNKSKPRHDYAALYTLANHISKSDLASDALKRRATSAMKAVNELAEMHIAAIKVPKRMGPGKEAWIAHLPMFLRSFMDVPAREEFARTWGPILEKQHKEAWKGLKKYYAALRKGKEADAFEAGIAAVQKGYLDYDCGDLEFRKKMADLRKRAKQIKAPKKAVKDYDGLFKDFEKAIAAGMKKFDAVNQKAPKF